MADEGDKNSNEVRFAVEACQASYWFLPIEVDTNNQPEDDFSLFVAQEMGCNSLGTALGFKANGASYAEYKTYIENTLFNTEGANGFKQILMDEQVYNTLPASGTLLK